MTDAPSKPRPFIKRFGNILFFIGGFLVDIVTLQRIDSRLDLIWQGSYLVLMLGLILLQSREEWGLWHPGARMQKLWRHNVEALHFFYGGLLSNYCIFYFKSSTASRSSIFLVLVVLLMVANEMPQIKKAGHYLRLGLYAFCLASYFNMLIPVLAGRMGALMFTTALILSAIVIVSVIWLLGRWWAIVIPPAHAPLPDRRREAWFRLGLSPVAVLVILGLFYALKWIPPVPLSMQFGGVYHQVEKVEGNYRLTYLRQPGFCFWRHNDRVFYARPGDTVNCFVRIFAPTHFSHRVILRWAYVDPTTGKQQFSDRIPLNIVGGRDNGFRGTATKENYRPGHWQIDVETDDERLIGSIPFEVRLDTSQDDRPWRTIDM